MRLRLPSCLPVILLACIAVVVSVQAGCSGKDDECTSTRGGCLQDPDDETFLEKVDPFD